MGKEQIGGIGSDVEGEAQRRAAATYNLAADHFDHPACSFWGRFGQGTVDRLKLSPGATVLDVCCGSGASALPAAAAVGPAGRVLGVDLAESLLALGRAKAAAAGLTNLELRRGDLLDLGLPEGSFDAVVCVFGIHFAPDMPEAVRELWKLVRPGGALALTTWGPRAFEPASSCFWEAVGAERPDLVRAYQPWDRIVEPDQIRSVLRPAGIVDAEITAVPGTHPLRSPDDWWVIALGSGFRRTIEQLGPVAAGRVHERCLARLAENGVDRVDANVLYATARR